jgi:hypothetical protein
MRGFTSIAALSALALVAGCSAKSDSATASTPAMAAAPASSPLAKVKVGMTKQEVGTILGMPTNQVSYSTGKAWIPFYFGDDHSDEPAFKAVRDGISIRVGAPRLTTARYTLRGPAAVADVFTRMEVALN